MRLRENAFLKAIRAGRQQVGLWVSLSNAYAAEAVAPAGYDWALLDMEHCPNELTSLLGQLQAFEPTPTTPIVRPDWNDAVKVKRLLDMGVPGLLFPMVESIAEAEAAVAACRYPPRGNRGVAGTMRANRFGRVTDYFTEVENQTAILIQLETVQAVENATAFAEIDGIDGIFFGPADIGADMGILGQPMHPDIWAFIRPAARKLMDRRMPVGTLVSDPAFATELLNDGFSFVACGSDAGLLAKAADTLLKTVKDNLT
ncbi:HpcH/HpaI aldolase family protein [Sulfitobacter aestuariivivens]|uniref:4-hydroxy-2-oxo-heptane-1,7-dioate aldolase n=1 Tax=Sulfitobacter aestuariivivens TaxID=2766981 RepID=A0A927HG49_9RHOB|nr:aldolase/citrate lyase family protein [Sulfitobacter aestuariivivens]MBD3663895.1 4-hydroxy-2-oxo-heptane-1,7-dioate aldolase [Sulfitobacter aestuariivivens]